MIITIARGRHQIGRLFVMFTCLISSGSDFDLSSAWSSSSSECGGDEYADELQKPWPSD